MLPKQQGVSLAITVNFCSPVHYLSLKYKAPGSSSRMIIAGVAVAVVVVLMATVATLIVIYITFTARKKKLKM